MKCNPAEHKSTFLLRFLLVCRRYCKIVMFCTRQKTLQKETTRLSARFATFCDMNRSGESKSIITNHIGLWYLFAPFIISGRLLRYLRYFTNCSEYILTIKRALYGVKVKCWESQCLLLAQWHQKFANSNAMFHVLPICFVLSR